MYAKKKPAVTFQTWWGFVLFCLASSTASDVVIRLLGWR